MNDPSTPEPDLAEEESAAPASRRDAAADDGGVRRGLSARHRLIIVAAAVAVLAIVAVVLLLTQQGRVEPLTVEPTTITQAPPTPDQDPIERDTSTPLLEALPDTVLGYAVSDQVESEALADLDPLEGWQLTYTSSAGDVVLQVGQWLTADEASEAMAAFTEGTTVEEGEVLVAGEQVGAYATVAVDEGTERTVWTNRTAIFVAEGATGSTGPFYDAFPF